MVVREPIHSPKREPRSEVTESLYQLLENYLRYHRIEGSTQATILHKKRQLGVFVRWLESEGHSLIPAKVTIDHVELHLEWMIDRGLAPATRHTRLRALKTWFRWMKERKRIDENPTEGLKLPRVPKIRKPFLKEEQFNALLELCPLNTLLGSRRQSMLWLFVTSGIRRYELTMLRVEDLDWKAETVRVIHGKGQKERRIPFDRQAQKVMLRYLEQREWKGLDSDRLWITEGGAPLQWHGVGQDLKRLMKRAGVEVQDVCHIFRRTFAANAVRQHIPRPYVQAIAGWSSPQMLDLYVAAMEAEEGAIEAFRDFRPFSS